MLPVVSIKLNADYSAKRKSELRRRYEMPMHWLGRDVSNYLNIARHSHELIHVHGTFNLHGFRLDCIDITADGSRLIVDRREHWALGLIAAATNYILDAAAMISRENSANTSLYNESAFLVRYEIVRMFSKTPQPDVETVEPAATRRHRGVRLRPDKR